MSGDKYEDYKNDLETFFAKESKRNKQTNVKKSSTRNQSKKVGTKSRFIPFSKRDDKNDREAEIVENKQKGDQEMENEDSNKSQKKQKSFEELNEEDEKHEKLKLVIYQARKTNCPVIIQAAREGDAFLVGALYDKGYRFNVRDKYGNTALHVAIRRGNYRMAHELLNRNIPVLEHDRNGDTALHIAARVNQRKLVKRILEAGANVDAADEHLVTPLMIASRNGALGVFKILLEHGASMTLMDDHFKTALDLSTKEGRAILKEHVLGENATPIQPITKNQEIQRSPVQQFSYLSMLTTSNESTPLSSETEIQPDVLTITSMVKNNKVEYTSFENLSLESMSQSKQELKKCTSLESLIEVNENQEGAFGKENYQLLSGQTRNSGLGALKNMDSLLSMNLAKTSNTHSQDLYGNGRNEVKRLWWELERLEKERGAANAKKILGQIKQRKVAEKQNLPRKETEKIEDVKVAREAYSFMSVLPEDEFEDASEIGDEDENYAEKESYFKKGRKKAGKLLSIPSFSAQKNNDYESSDDDFGKPSTESLKTVLNSEDLTIDN